MKHTPLTAGLLLALAVCATACGRDSGIFDRAVQGGWLVELGTPQFFPGGLSVGGEPIDALRVDPRGFISLGIDADHGRLAAPRPLDAVQNISLIAPLWARFDTTGCRLPGRANMVLWATDPDRRGLTITWWQVVPEGCPPSAEPLSFSAHIARLDDGAVRITFEYIAGEAAAGLDARSGVAIGGRVVELFPDGAPDTPPDRFKALLDGGSEGRAGVWVIEFDGAGELVDDPDADGVRGLADNCPRVANPGQFNLDGDRFGDACDSDADADGIREEDGDNCPRVHNADQRDTDGDSAGDACDPDDDGDGWPDALDLCPLTPEHARLDLDLDGLGDACDPDVDGDDPIAARRHLRLLPDRCPFLADPARGDRDADGLGDVCDLAPDVPCRGLACRLELDSDGDRVADAADVCPTVFDPIQRDGDRDGIGDACDPDRDGDGVFDLLEHLDATLGRDLGLRPNPRPLPMEAP